LQPNPSSTTQAVLQPNSCIRSYKPYPPVSLVEDLRDASPSGALPVRCLDGDRTLVTNAGIGGGSCSSVNATSVRMVMATVATTMMATLGVHPPLSWSHRAKPVPKEDVSVTMVLADSDSWDGPPVCHSLDGRVWKGRRQISGREEPWRIEECR
jgi:hypothetical protein